jgi:hypothetical protein
MGRSRKGWYERKEIQKVTLDWVKMNCRLTEREKLLLQLINDRKLVRRDHLEIIAEPYRHAGKSRERILNKSINKLFNSMCLDKVHEEQDLGRGNLPAIVALDKGGSIFLNIPHKRRISQERKIINNETYIFRSLPVYYRHVNGINQMEVDTILFCEDNNYQILEWKHEHPLNFHYGSERIGLVPDIYMSIKIGKKKLFAFIEYDTGSENHRYKSEFPVLRDKIVKYKKYYGTDLWKEYATYYPVIIFVTEDPKRIPYINTKCKEMKLRGVGAEPDTYTNVLERLASLC